MNTKNLANIVSSTSLTWDILIILFLLLASFFYGLTFGKKRMLLFLISTYISKMIFDNLPSSLYSIFKIQQGSFKLSLVILAVLLFLVYVLLAKSQVRSVFKIPRKGERSFFNVLVLSVMEMGLLGSFLFSFFPEKVIKSLAILTKQTFVSPTAKFIWLVLPILSLLLIKKRDDE